MATKNTTTPDIYAEVTARIIAELETGAAPWSKTWSGEGAFTVSAPRNGVSQKAYRGINNLLLSLDIMANGYASPYYVTFKQALDLGGNVRKGEKSCRVVLYKQAEKKDAKDGERSTYAFLRYFYVFNVAQCDGLPEHLMAAPAPRTTTQHDRHEFDDVVTATGARIFNGNDKACYIPSVDVIQMPDVSDFDTAANYRATLAHELVHWTGAKKRLDRDLTTRFGTERYAMEELVAELGAAFLSAKHNIGATVSHAGYIASWLKVLKADKKAIFTAASMAQKAADYISPEAVPAEAEGELMQEAA